MKNAIFWDVAQCGYIINAHFGGTCSLYLQGRRNNASEEKCQTVATLKMGATRFSERLVYNKPKGCHIPEDGILQSRCCKNLKSYKV
jgi:hypothetical protein